MTPLPGRVSALECLLSGLGGGAPPLHPGSPLGRCALSVSKVRLLRPPCAQSEPWAQAGGSWGQDRHPVSPGACIRPMWPCCPGIGHWRGRSGQTLVTHIHSTRVYTHNPTYTYTCVLTHTRTRPHMCTHTDAPHAPGLSSLQHFPLLTDPRAALPVSPSGPRAGVRGAVGPGGLGLSRLGSSSAAAVTYFSSARAGAIFRVGIFSSFWGLELSCKFNLLPPVPQ